jgi:hypothetical protein
MIIAADFNQHNVASCLILAEMQHVAQSCNDMAVLRLDFGTIQRKLLESQRGQVTRLPSRFQLLRQRRYRGPQHIRFRTSIINFLIPPGPGTVSRSSIISLSKMGSPQLVARRLNQTLRHLIHGFREAPNHLVPCSRGPKVWIKGDRRGGCTARCLRISSEYRLRLLLIGFCGALWKFA